MKRICRHLDQFCPWTCCSPALFMFHHGVFLLFVTLFRLQIYPSLLYCKYKYLYVYCMYMPQLLIGQDQHCSTT